MLQIICGIIAGGVLAALGFAVSGGGFVGLIVSLLLAALGYVAGSTLTEPERRIGHMLASALPNGQKAADAIDAANSRLNAIAMLTRQVNDPQVKAEADDFVAATRSLVDYVAKDTSAYQILRHYITVYGEQTQKLLRSYVDVESSGARDQAEKARTETIEALQVLERTAAGELSRAVSSKTLGIAADSDAIQRLASMDGYQTAAPSGPETTLSRPAADSSRQREQDSAVSLPTPAYGERDDAVSFSTPVRREQDGAVSFSTPVRRERDDAAPSGPETTLSRPAADSSRQREQDSAVSLPTPAYGEQDSAVPLSTPAGGGRQAPHAGGWSGESPEQPEQKVESQQ